jgi:antibiotic biosynthesis monooxygenase (ABM) superfamily enzyme
VLGVVLGTAALGFVIDSTSPAGVVLMLANLVVTPALTWLAVVVAVRLVRPWTLRAGAAANLRTE